jgi:2-aminoethylphosphonate-pyruvate transaminase
MMVLHGARMPTQVLLTPGPVNVSSRVREALVRGDLCHREPEFGALLASIRRRLVEAFVPAGTHSPVLLTGSGTAALEAAVISSVSPEGKLLAVRNGVYGDRIAAMARAAGIPVVEVTAAWTERPPLAAIAAALSADPAIETVAVVHHETTTGLINPVREVGAIVRDAARLFLVDSISGLGGEEIDVGAEGVDLCVGTANKSIQGLPGMSFVLVRPEVMARLATYPARSVYLNLPAIHAAQARDTVPFTAAVQVAYAFDEALAELLEEGVAARVARYRRAALHLREGFAAVGLRFVLPPEVRANALTSLWLPEGMVYAAIHDGLKARGFVVYEGQGRLQREIFRVANMGHLTLADFDRFLDALRDVLERSRAGPDRGARS